MNAIFNFLNSIHPLSNDLQEFLCQHLRVKSVRKKQLLLRAGHICQHIYFIERGLLRCFYMVGEHEVSSWFMKENDAVISVQSFFKQQPSYESIEALEDSDLYYISYDELQFIYQSFPDFNIVGRILTEYYYGLSEQRLYSLRMHRSNERYQFLISEFPQLIQRVPSKYLASYLGVTEETLSRIRSKRY